LILDFSKPLCEGFGDDANADEVGGRLLVQKGTQFSMEQNVEGEILFSETV